MAADVKIREAAARENAAMDAYEARVECVEAVRDATGVTEGWLQVVQEQRRTAGGAGGAGAAAATLPRRGEVTKNLDG